MSATAEMVPSAVPKTVEVSGEALFDVLVSLLKAEEAFRTELDKADTRGTTEVGNAVCGLYEAAFGPMFIDDDGPELDVPACYAPVYALAEERAKAEPLETESKFAELEPLIEALERAKNAVGRIAASVESLEEKGVIPAVAA